MQPRLVIAMVGVVGSGKSSVAKFIARLLGADIVSADAIRIMLRKRGEGYGRVRVIMLNAVSDRLRHGRDVIIDSDFVDPKKRRWLINRTKRFGAKVTCVRAYAEMDTIIGRMSRAKFSLKRDLFKSNTIALREMWRRTPLHYRWTSVHGGRFILRKLPIRALFEIDTSGNWKPAARKIARALRQQARRK